MALPNYMKSTTSADARREQANVRRNKPQDETSSSKNVTKTSDGIRSLMKLSAGFKPVTALVKKGPALKGEGTSGVKVCPYSHCSLNGHDHELLPPLKSFVSARRQALKTERSIRMRCQSPKVRLARGSRSCGELIGRGDAATSKVCGENLEQIAADKSPQSSAQEANSEVLERDCVGSMPNVNLHKLDSQSSDMSREKSKFYPTYLADDYGCASKMEEESGDQGGQIVTSAGFFDEISADEVSQEFFDEESLSSETLFTGKNRDSVGSFYYLENVCNKKPSALVLVPVPDPAPAGKNDFLFESSQNGETTMCCDAMDEEEHNLKDESVPSEDAKTEMGNQAPNLLRGPAEEIATSVDSATCKVIEHDQDRMKNECNQAENFNEVCIDGLENEAECNAVHEVDSRNMEKQETEDKRHIQATVKCEKSDQHSDEPACFNPRELHFLPLEPDPEAEKVNLKHQDLNDRKSSEEWMVDYALREAVTKIGSSQERKVASLVEAFERVLPTSKS